MLKKPGIVIIAAQSVIIALLLIYLVLSVEDRVRIDELSSELARSEVYREACLERNDSLFQVLQQIRITNAVPPFLDKWQLEELEKRGLGDPVNDLRNDLVSKPSLIRATPVLGGKMGFYFSDGIHILNKRWVLAYFEDGHVSGALLLKYEIGEGGGISWELLDDVIY